ncbi:MAG: trypsin-like peptidase domain-containing protein [Planctomycetota bacterium]|nr:trypsin-like peptidase domain-containing protein [Planctomycetota bacterium]
MQRVLILGTATLALAAVGVPRYQGIQDRMDRLEGQNAAIPRREKSMQRDLDRIGMDLRQLSVVLEESAQLTRAERDAVLGNVSMLQGELEAAEARWQALSEGAAAEQQVEQLVVAQTQARLMALEAELDGDVQDWDCLRSAVDAAASLASETHDELAGLMEPEESVRWRALVGPSVQLSGTSTVGSGVLLPSYQVEGSDKSTTLLVTAWHVVRDIRADSITVDPTIPVTIYGEDGSQRHEQSRLIAFEPGIDVAVLELLSDEAVAHGAYLATSEDVDQARIFRPVIAVGCPLGNDPIPTRGEVAATSHSVDGSTYWMINAPTYIGNSGGAIFDARSHRVVGVFSKIYTHGSLRPTIVPHMGLVTPMDKVYAWLETVPALSPLEGPNGVELRLHPEIEGGE